MADDSPATGDEPSEPVAPAPTRPPAGTDDDFTGVLALLLILILPVMMSQIPYELTAGIRYSYRKNVTGIVFAVAEITLAWLLIWRTRVSWAEAGLVRRLRFTDVLTAAALILFAHVLYRFAAKVLRPDGWYTDPLTMYGVHPVGLLSWVLTVTRIAGAAFAEELLFRGYLYTRLERLLPSKLWATILAAMMFGACHFYQGFPGALGATLSGVLYTVAFAATRRLWLGTLAHAGYNLSLSVLAIDPEVSPERDAQYETGLPDLQW